MRRILGQPKSPLSTIYHPKKSKMLLAARAHIPKKHLAAYIMVLLIQLFALYRSCSHFIPYPYDSEKHPAFWSVGVK